MMKRIFAASAVALVAAMFMIGCEWSTHDEDVQGYNDTDYQWVSFSGTYQRYLTEALEKTHTDIHTETEEEVVTHAAVYHDEIVRDENGDPLLTADGEIQTQPRLDSPEYTEVVATTHDVSQEVSEGADESQLSGDLVVNKATGKAVRTLTVIQKGQRLKITDNAGGSFKGTISDLRSSMGKSATSALVPGDVVVATFSASGKSGAGLNTTLTGTFQGKVVDGPAFSKRTITGTWIEQGGQTASIYGAAEPISGIGAGNEQ